MSPGAPPRRTRRSRLTNRLAGWRYSSRSRPDVFEAAVREQCEAKIPVSRQFVGFTGGVLTAIGVIAGSLVIAVLVGVLKLLIEGPSIPEQ